MEFPERLLLTYKQREETPTVVEDEEPPLEDAKPELTYVQFEVTSGPLQEEDTGHLLGLNKFNPGGASAIEESNALALAIVPSGSADFQIGRIERDVTGRIIKTRAVESAKDSCCPDYSDFVRDIDLPKEQLDPGRANPTQVEIFISPQSG